MAPIPKDENKRQRIIEAALKVFAEVGVSNGKIATIAEKAGIGKGTVYEYFSSKEDVFAAVFEVFIQKMMAGYNALIQQDMDPVEKIELILDYTYDFFDESLSGENSADWLIFLEIFLQGYRDETHGGSKLSFKNILHDLYRMFRPLIDDGISRGAFKPLDAEHVTFIIFAAIDGIGLHYFINRDHYDKEKLKQTTKDIYLRGLLNTQRKGT